MLCMDNSNNQSHVTTPSTAQSLSTGAYTARKNIFKERGSYYAANVEYIRPIIREMNNVTDCYYVTVDVITHICKETFPLFQLLIMFNLLLLIF